MAINVVQIYNQNLFNAWKFQESYKALQIFNPGLQTIQSENPQCIMCTLCICTVWLSNTYDIVQCSGISKVYTYVTVYTSINKTHLLQAFLFTYII